MLCVRLVFCLYAEDAGIFGYKSMFGDYVNRFEAKDVRAALLNLFKVLDQKPEERDVFLEDELAQFPYVNGGLFTENDQLIPPFTDEIKNLLVEKASEDFDWSQISPTIFGAVFESTLNPETRRKGGMHYTSIENIHKVIDPLFLDDLYVEFEEICAIKAVKTRNEKLIEFQQKLGSLTFLDPACGSGNFLTETYLSLRRLENKAIRMIIGDANEFNFDDSRIHVHINQFYGIEINDFAVTVAKTALWIAESQMMKETALILGHNMDFLPLKTNASIIESNALQIEWNDVAPKDKLNYIMGNPPFIGATNCDARQKQEIVDLFGKIKLSNSIDYVAGWYYKAAEYSQGTNIHCAFVSTNSITQGEQVAPIWNTLITRFNVNIIFAYKTFVWDSEATQKAHVHCVIIGFKVDNDNKEKFIYSNDLRTPAKNISPYLIDSPTVLINSRSTPLNAPNPMLLGNKPADGGNLIISEAEKEEILSQEPYLQKYIHKYLGAEEYINNKIRYCFWLKDAEPSEIRRSKELCRRLDSVRIMRENSTAKPTREKSVTPHLFFFISQPDSNYLIVPSTSSERRRYIPVGFMDPEIIASNSATIIPNAGLYDFGIITSNVHMAWMRAVAGRLEMRYRYSNNIVYNNFPWPSPTDEQKAKVEQTAQAILDARAKYPNSSLADLYDPLTMPPELLKAHRENDKAVMQAYGFDYRTMTESECVAELFKLYQNLVK